MAAFRIIKEEYEPRFRAARAIKKESESDNNNKKKETTNENNNNNEETAMDDVDNADGEDATKERKPEEAANNKEDADVNKEEKPEEAANKEKDDTQKEEGGEEKNVEKDADKQEEDAEEEKKEEEKEEEDEMVCAEAIHSYLREQENVNIPLSVLQGLCKKFCSIFPEAEDISKNVPNHLTCIFLTCCLFFCLFTLKFIFTFSEPTNATHISFASVQCWENLL